MTAAVFKAGNKTLKTNQGLRLAPRRQSIGRTINPCIRSLKHTIYYAMNMDTDKIKLVGDLKLLFICYLWMKILIFCV